MKTRRVIVLPYDEAWQGAFDAISAEIRAALGAYALAVEHVGSTSVVGMMAKPCIDIDVVIEDCSVLGEVVRLLSEIGYIHEGDLGIAGREAFAYTGKEHLMAHHLYVCPADSQELRRHVTFRSLLRTDAEARREYSEVKERAAELFPYDVDKYIEYKSPCIKKLYKRCGLESAGESD